MKPKTLAFFSCVPAILTVFVLVLCTACWTESVFPSSSVDATSSPLSNFGNVSVRVFGSGTFESYNQTLVYPVEFSVPPISIYWMGLIFNGLLENAGAGTDITYKVHGSVSADGAWIESMTYSKEIGLNPGNYFQVTLKNIPLTKGVDGNGNPVLVCNKTASDVQRFVGQIKYASLGVFTYLATDWGDSTYPATLTVTLATGEGSKAGDGISNPRGGMM